MREIKLARSDNGKTVEAQVGDSVMIELPENPTTGYVWTLDVKEGIGTVHLSDSTYTAATESAIGGGGMRTFMVKVQSSGIATIEMKLRRQWEPESAAIDGFKAVIKAGDNP
jgi:inhibitor of cysteine peptidase